MVEKYVVRSLSVYYHVSTFQVFLLQPVMVELRVQPYASLGSGPLSDKAK